MSTRGILGFKINGEYKLTYNHSDSYPESLGHDISDFINFINLNNGWDNLKNIVKKLKMVSEDSHPSKKEIEKYKRFANLIVSNQTYDDWYCLLREIQGIDTFYEIYNGNIDFIIDSNYFILDSLFCEYAYVINLDDMVLELYKGFQKEPDLNNPFGIEVSHVISYSGEEYYPCKMIGKICLFKNISIKKIEYFYDLLLLEEEEEYTQDEFDEKYKFFEKNCLSKKTCLNCSDSDFLQCLKENNFELDIELDKNIKLISNRKTFLDLYL